MIFNIEPASEGPSAATSLDAGRTGVFSLLLLGSSVTFLMAERNLQHGRKAGFLNWLGATIVLGVVFLGGQAWEYAGLINDGVYVSSNLFASTFFTVTGFHGLHVAAGLVALAIMFVLGKKGYLTQAQSGPFGAIGVYWHFVDVVWVCVFAIIYLRVFQW